MTKQATDVWKLPNGKTMPKQITLGPIEGVRSGDATVVFREAHRMTAGDRKQVFSQIPEDVNGYGRLISVSEGVAAMLIESWTITTPEVEGEEPERRPLPSVEIDVLNQLDLEDYDAIIDAVRPARDLLFPGSSQREKSDPEHPKGPSNE